MTLTLTLAITKAAAKLSRALGRGGGHALPGYMAERLDPNLGQKLAAGLKHGVILVTGTNGKTTTTKLIASILEANGERVLSNSTGSNLKRGITSALIKGVNLRGRTKATIGLFEVDEASLRHVAAGLKPRAIVVLNLFRDQLDRYGELDTTAALIGEGIAATDADVYLNADDPLVASLARYARKPALVHYFGIKNGPHKPASAYDMAVDSDRCPICHKPLIFSRVFYGHIGHYACAQKHFSRPKPQVSITAMTRADIQATAFTVDLGGERSDMHFPLPGTYNLYNALAAIALAHGLAVPTATIAAALARSQAAFGRVERVELEGRNVYVLLVKNPAGFAQVLETFLVGQTAPRVLMAINDLPADGRDVSWLWDVPIEALVASKPMVITAGTRGADMALRLHYAGIKPHVAESYEAALNALIKETPRGSTAFILPSYTAMLAIRRALSKRTHMQKAGS